MNFHAKKSTAKRPSLIEYHSRARVISLFLPRLDFVPFHSNSILILYLVRPECSEIHPDGTQL